MSVRKLTNKAKQDIIKAFHVYGGSGVPEFELINMLARHAIGLLEVDSSICNTWYNPNNIYCPLCKSGDVVNICYWNARSQDDESNSVYSITEYQCKNCDGQSFWLKG